MQTHNAFLGQIDAIVRAGMSKRRDLSDLATRETIRRIERIKANEDLPDAERVRLVSMTVEQAAKRVSQFAPNWQGIVIPDEP